MDQSDCGDRGDGGDGDADAGGGDGGDGESANDHTDDAAALMAMGGYEPIICYSVTLQSSNSVLEMSAVKDSLNSK